MECPVHFFRCPWISDLKLKSLRDSTTTTTLLLLQLCAAKENKMQPIKLFVESKQDGRGKVVKRTNQSRISKTKQQKTGSKREKNTNNETKKGPEASENLT